MLINRDGYKTSAGAAAQLQLKNYILGCNNNHFYRNCCAKYAVRIII